MPPALRCIADRSDMRQHPNTGPGSDGRGELGYALLVSDVVDLTGSLVSFVPECLDCPLKSLRVDVRDQKGSGFPQRPCASDTYIPATGAVL